MLIDARSQDRAQRETSPWIFFQLEKIVKESSKLLVPKFQMDLITLICMAKSASSAQTRLCGDAEGFEKSELASVANLFAAFPQQQKKKIKGL